MCLWYRVCFLVAGLYLSSSAPTPEDCERLVTPLPLDDPTKLHGRWNLIAGFSDHEAFESIMKTADSSWLRFTPSPSSNDTLMMTDELMIKGKCNSSRSTVTLSGDSAKLTHDKNLTSTSHLLPSHDGCLTFSMNTTVPQLDAPIRSVYIAARLEALDGCDLKTFQQQAECLNFSSPMNPLYHPKKDFCPDALEVDEAAETNM